MKLIALSLMMATLFSCGSIPKDPSIPEKNNHMRIEMEINGETHVGIAGFDYSNITELDSVFLKIPPIYKGSIEFWSDRCGRSFSIGYEENETVEIELTSLMPSIGTAKKCSYRIIRRIYGTDNPMIGYFFLNYHKETTPLRVVVNGKSFSGISFLQAREGSIIPSKDKNIVVGPNASIQENKVLAIYPTGQRGNLTFRGCGITFPPIEFETTPIIIDLADVFPDGLSVNNSCDYEITSSNYDNPLIEESVLVLNVYKRETSWLETPHLLYDDFWESLTVSFNNQYIIGISIGNKTCSYTKSSTNKSCRKKCPKDQPCIVRAVTTSGRFFWALVRNGKILEVK